MQRILSQNIVDVSVADHHGRTALHIAAAAGNNQLGEVPFFLDNLTVFVGV